MISNREIGQIMLEEADLQRMCKRLIDSANSAGGKDNITTVAIQYGEERKKEEKEKEGESSCKEIQNHLSEKRNRKISYLEIKYR